jgi:septal ring factor EnvC (AmiA/AmiB activator)
MKEVMRLRDEAVEGRHSAEADLRRYMGERDAAISSKDELRARISEIESEREALRGERDAAASDVDELRARLRDIESERDVIRGERDASDGVIATLSEDLDRQRGEMEALLLSEESLRNEVMIPSPPSPSILANQ